MKFFLFALFLSFSSPCTSDDKVDLSKLQLCLKNLQRVVPEPSFHRFQKNGMRTFEGSIGKKKGLFFEDRSGDIRFISKDKLESPVVLYLANGEKFKISYRKKILIERLNDKIKGAKPIILYPLNESAKLIKPLSSLIVKYGVTTLKKLDKRSKFMSEFKDFNPDGLKQYKVLNLCKQAAIKTGSESLAKVMDKLTAKLRSISDLPLK